ncbi:MAG: rRNA (cytidine-2'-O-)-methyltransferase, partial [Rhodobacteraceae bacterium]|nr:rRNA (cytidine-2'-O-)-methyltransferase [Paracoccaceae bacterium]
DPGYKLVRAAIDSQVPVVPIPGASAVMAALVAAGLPTDRFMFAGFLPAKAAARRRALEDLRTVKATLVFFDAANRAAESLTDMNAVFGAREAALCRELTKLHEETRRGPLATLADQARIDPPRGEVVIVVAGASEHVDESAFDIDGALRDALVQHRLRDAVDLVTATSGKARREVYARALALTRDGKT